jgi:murein DD-endopeptidase MepM/ murein hydrolase activator NlpD
LRRRVARVGAIAVLATNGFFASASGAATVASDRARIEEIQKEIAKSGAKVESLGQKAAEASATLDGLRVKIRRDERLLVADEQSQREAAALARHAAVVAYADAGSVDPPLAIFDRTSSITEAMSGRHYLDIVSAHWDDAITRLEVAKSRTDDDRGELLKAKSGAQQALDQATRAQADARAAIADQNATLTRLQADLTSSLQAQKRQQESEARQTAERAVATALAQATQKVDAAPMEPPSGPAPRLSPPTIAIPPPKPVTGVGYSNPFRSIASLTAERIDSGVDYAGTGPVYAVGDGVVVNIYANDWPGGTFIAYRLTDGPAEGLFVYTAEDLSPQVTVGSAVTANTVIGQMYGGPHGIEIGWADGSRIPNAMARSYGQYQGGNSTAFGYNFSRFLQGLGAPGGILQNDPTGTLPAGWPEW